MSEDYMAETALLGCVLSGYPHMDELQEIVMPGDFLNPQHEHIFAAACSVADKGNHVDALTVKIALGPEANRLPGGPVYLINLAQSAPHTMSAPTYATEVRAQAFRRRVVSTSVTLNQLSQSGLDIDEMADQMRNTMDRAIETTPENQSLHAMGSLPNVIDSAQHLKTPVLSTGWSNLDDVIGGLAPGRLIVVGSRPSVGKSIMGGNLAFTMAHDHRHPALVCTMEMSESEYTQRLLASYAEVDLTSIERGQATESMMDRINAVSGSLKEMPLYINDTASQTISSIRLATHRLKRRHNDAALVVVDYLQLMQIRDRKMNRAEQIGEITRGLKVMASDYGVCVVAMSQLNRESVHRPDKRPNMADLRESGSIEQDADIVILLHRPEDAQNRVEVMIEKNRSGPVKTTALDFQGAFARLREFPMAYAPVVYETTIPD